MVRAIYLFCCFHKYSLDDINPFLLVDYLQMTSIVMMTMRNGQVKMLESVYLRGGNVKFVILPDTLKSVPILSKVREAAARKAEAAAGREPAGRGRGGRGSGRGGSSVGEKRGR